MVPKDPKQQLGAQPPLALVPSSYPRSVVFELLNEYLLANQIFITKLFVHWTNSGEPRKESGGRKLYFRHPLSNRILSVWKVYGVIFLLLEDLQMYIMGLTLTFQGRFEEESPDLHVWTFQFMILNRKKRASSVASWSFKKLDV